MSDAPEPLTANGFQIRHRWTDDDGNFVYQSVPKRMDGEVVSHLVIELFGGDTGGDPADTPASVVIDDPWLAKDLVSDLIDIFWKAS